ncbi:unnamed protein product [Notodromas monacha]|uniref:Uncharacterized protein n=1 Tax=Notodromas monacha TaxID=399045 RepID=A0A7R9BCK2_9CRUS|nr:unnamed protein product [Notodromas monacha]CAG0912838.1 unnamed protein product [Notodromas monacha]
MRLTEKRSCSINIFWILAGLLISCVVVASALDLDNFDRMTRNRKRAGSSTELPENKTIFRIYIRPTTGLPREFSRVIIM